MAGVSFIQHGGKRILYEDYSGADVATIPALLDKAHKLIAAEPENSVLALVNVRGTKFNPEVSQMMKDFVKSNTPYIKASAVIGMSGLQSIVYKGILRFTGRRNLHVLNSEDEAKDFLAALT